MPVNPDFKDLLKIFNEFDVKYLRDLIRAKIKAGRDQDLLDLKRLQAIIKR